MLTHLHIENYALIRESNIAFDEGFVAITGETGAGKSILLGALGLLLGQRADLAVLADRERKCIVEAQFDVSGLNLEPLFAQNDIDYDDTLILRREILPSAKSRAFANDTPVPLTFLRELGSHLIDIHSQHQTLTLAESGFRLQLLDTLASSPALTKYRTAYAHYSTLKHELEQLTSTEAANRREQDYLQFQFDELTSATLHPDEQEQLEHESQILSHAESLREALAVASAAIDDDTDNAVLARLRSAKSALAHVAPYHTHVASLLERIESSLIELDDIHSELQSVSDAITFSPERQQEVDDRLSRLYQLEKKHGVESVAALIALRDELDARLQSISSLDLRIQSLMEEVDTAFARLQTAADALSHARTVAGKHLSTSIIPILHELGMPEARFEVRLSPATTYTAQGHDAVQFLFNANRGSELRDIAQVASGGELSRLMLAIKSMLTSHSLLPTIIFDEIDTGVSGDIAGAVARTLCHMAERMQVVAITHLPQIAARASQHLKVYKHVEDDHTVSRIKPLAIDERVAEVATMLSSGSPTEAALQTARELML